VKWLEEKTIKSSLPSRGSDSRSQRSSDWPSGHDGPAQLPGNYSSVADGHSQESSASGSSSDRSTGILVTITDSPAMFPRPPDAPDKGLGLDDGHRMCCTEETDLSQMNTHTSVACVVK